MAISPKTRFEVFKRDNFTCRYCGRKTPQVVLEVDHIIPVSKGGTDDMDNLVTSCWECNRGKGAALLTDIPNEPSLHDKTILILERELQLAEYNEVKRRQREREDAQIDELLDYWDELANGHARRFPEPHMLRYFLRYIPVEDIKDAMEIAMAKRGDWHGVKYLIGILRNWKSGTKPPWEED
jgi:hypothetical protein